MTIKMNKMKLLPLLAVLAACSNESVEPVAEVAPEKTTASAGKPTSQFDGTVTKIGSPFRIQYKIIGTPVVGSPLAIELRVSSTIPTDSVQLSYSIPDETSMMFPQAQLASIASKFADNEDWTDQRVTIVPQREGRVYLNVAASMDTADGRTTTMMAIPVQVGEGGRVLEEHGEIATDEDGEAIRVLTPEE